VGVYENKTFIAMEYVEGKTLRELIMSDELTIERITDISVQICEGLNEAHSKGITHRDIKPENILIDEKGKVKIVDFGLAKIKNLSRGITKQDSTVGTLKYMSPEQIRNQSVDHRSDIWSFGVILYEMITGKYPFKGEHDASLFYSIINQSPEPLARYKANISEGFQRVIDKSLDKDPETRYQHIDELLSDLRREKKESGEHTIGKRRVKKLTKRVPIIISAVALIVLSAAVIYFLSNPTKKVAPPKHTQLTFDGNIYFYENGLLFDRSQISPDGQFTAYVAGEGNEKSIYVKDNSGEQAIEIFKGLRSVSSLRWSPTGNEIFFSVLIDTTWSTFIMPKLGGKVQQLQNIQYGCWSPDGNLIAGIHSSGKRIRLIKPETNEIEKTIELTGDFTWVLEIDWSPDGEEILFQTHNNNGGIEEIWTIKTDGTHQQNILQDSNYIFSPRWSTDGNLIYYLRANETTQDLMKIEFPSNTLDRESKVVQTGLLAHGFSITGDNKKLCYTKYNYLSNLWSFTSDKKENVFTVKKLTEGTSIFKMPRISPDGLKIVFISKGNIFEMSLDIKLIKQLTFLNSECYAVDWNPNGKEIVYFSGPDLYKLPLETHIPTVLKTANNGGDLFWESASEIFYSTPDGQNYYIFNPLTEENKLLVANDSVGWIYNPCLSPDNSNIAVFWNRYLNNELARGLWIISLEDSAQNLLLKGSTHPLGWSKDSKWIYAINSEKTPPELLMINVNTGKAKIIFTFPSDRIDLYSGVDISSDGKTIVCAIPEINTDVWIIENFDSDLE
jgi:serine/threonine protein kinase